MQQLSEKTVQLITSGQVITSVSNAVKELIENSIDAGATHVDVKLEKYGLDKIEVQDNGCGVKEEDVHVMCKAHFTSKINNHEDLLQLESYGFRGEALHSLAALSKLTITSKTKYDTAGKLYSINHKGEVVETKSIPVKLGTSIIAKDLFKNLPVRYQVHNSSPKKKSEMRKIQEVVVEFGLIHPWLKLSLKHDKNLIWQKSSMTTLKESASYVFGISLMKELRELTYVSTSNEKSIKIYGFIPLISSDVSITGRSTAERVKLYFNNRPVTVPAANKLLKELYSKGLGLQTHMFPVAFLSITVDANTLDVNVDPNKRSIFCGVMSDILEALEKSITSLYNVDSTQESNTDQCSDKANGVEMSDPSPVDVAYVALNQCDSDHQLNTANGTAKPNESAHSKTCPQSVTNIIDFPTSCESTDKISADAANEEGIESVTNNNNISKPDKSIDESNDNNPRVMDSGEEMVNNGDDDENRKIHTASDNSVDTADRRIVDVEIDDKEDDIESHKPSEITVIESNKENRTENVSHAIDDDDNDDLNVMMQDLDDDEFTFEADNSTSNCPGGKLWSKGIITSENGQRKLQHVSVLGSSNQNQGEKRARPQSTALDTSPHHEPPRKRQSLLTPLRTTPIPKSTPVSHEIKSVAIDVDLEQIQEYSSQNETECSEANKINVIGQLKDPYKCILINQGDEIYVTNAYRLQEISIFERMLSNQRIPIDQLFDPIKLDKTVFPTDLWQILLRLSSEDRSENLSRNISDERIVANGFDIAINKADGNIEFEIVSLAPEIPFYGTSELIEILKHLSLDHGVALRDCRPIKVIAYLKSEAVRIARKSKTAFDTSSVISNLESFGIESFCLHEHPICHKLTPFKFHIS